MDKDVGIRGRGQGPTPRRSLPIVHVYTRTSVCVCVQDGVQRYFGSSCLKKEKRAAATSQR